ncbi:MAG: acid-soluble spore protein N [Caldibacillus sp.]
MSNPKRFPQGFTPDKVGTQSRDVHSNKGRKMADRTGKYPDVIQTKGE